MIVIKGLGGQPCHEFAWRQQDEGRGVCRATDAAHDHVVLMVMIMIIASQARQAPQPLLLTACERIHVGK